MSAIPLGGFGDVTGSAGKCRLKRQCSEPLDCHVPWQVVSEGFLEEHLFQVCHMMNSNSLYFLTTFHHWPTCWRVSQKIKNLLDEIWHAGHEKVLCWLILFLKWPVTLNSECLNIKAFRICFKPCSKCPYVTAAGSLFLCRFSMWMKSGAEAKKQMIASSLGTFPGLWNSNYLNYINQWRTSCWIWDPRSFWFTPEKSRFWQGNLAFLALNQNWETRRYWREVLQCFSF
jgi:hypothetical protein